MYVCAWGGIVYDMLVLVLKEVSGALIDVCVERSVSKRVYMTRTLTYLTYPTSTSTSTLINQLFTLNAYTPWISN